MLLSLKSEVLLRIFYKNPVQRYEKYLIYANNLMNFFMVFKEQLLKCLRRQPCTI